jgi:hypothetical protein
VRSTGRQQTKRAAENPSRTISFSCRQLNQFPNAGKHRRYMPKKENISHSLNRWFYGFCGLEKIAIWVRDV